MKAKLIEPVLDSLTPMSMPMTRDCVADIREIITRARRNVVRHVNTTMTLAYWLVGRRIVVEEQQGKRRAAYGEHLLERVSRELTADFGNGFGEVNLRNFREFYRQNPTEDQIRYALRSELSWTHHRAILRVPEAKARAYYLREAAADVRREAASLHADARRAHFRDRAQSRPDWRKEGEEGLTRCRLILYGRTFANDNERVAHLFNLYADAVKAAILEGELDAGINVRKKRF